MARSSGAFAPAVGQPLGDSSLERLVVRARRASVARPVRRRPADRRTRRRRGSSRAGPVSAPAGARPRPCVGRPTARRPAPADLPPNNQITSPGFRRCRAASTVPRAEADPGCRARRVDESAVLVDVAAVALGGLGGARPARPERLVEPGLESHHAAVGLVLRERQVQQLVCLVGRITANQVRRHVVGRPERRRELERATRRPGRRRRRTGRRATTTRWRCRDRRYRVDRLDRSAACTGRE